VAIPATRAVSRAGEPKMMAIAARKGMRNRIDDMVGIKEMESQKIQIRKQSDK
jgi:hypothetical protein